MSSPAPRRLAVLGRPVAHSKSPALHSAAYRVLGLDWSYEAIDLAAEDLGGFVAGLGPGWRGLSLTMPHKHAVLPLVDELDPVAELVGAANTLLFDGDRRIGANTDVQGVVGALAEHGIRRVSEVEMLGAGATAQSVLAAVAQLGAERVVVQARDPEKARAGLDPLAARLALELVVRPLGMQDRSLRIPDLVVSTLPGGVDSGLRFAGPVRAAAPLFDVAYAPWPTALGAQWAEAGGVVAGGLEMLLHQAIAQVRWFVTGAADGVLEAEDAVVAAMRESVGL